MPGKRITEDELDYIRSFNNQPENSKVKDVLEHLGVSKRAYYYRRNKAGIKKKHIRGWSDEEIDFLTKTVNTLTMKEQANILGRSISAIKNKRFEIQAVKYNSKQRLESVLKLASEGKIKYEIAKILGISVSGVNWYLYQYNIEYKKCDGSHAWRNDMQTIFGRHE